MVDRKYLLVAFLIGFLSVVAILYPKLIVNDTDVDITPAYDSGWLDITTQVGQYFNITHNLNNPDVIVDTRGKTAIDGGVHQRYLGGTGYTPGWNKTYGGPSDDFAYSLIQTSDGGYAIAATLGPTELAARISGWLEQVHLETYCGTERMEAQAMIMASLWSKPMMVDLQ